MADRSEKGGRRLRERRAGPSGTVLALLVGLVASGCGNESVTLFATPEDAPQTIRLSAAADGATRALLSWAGPSGEYAYRIDRNGAAVGDVASERFVDTGLAPGERYCWKVYARNGFGWQARSNEVCLGTTPTTREWRLERLAAGRWPALAVDASGELHACFTGAAGVGIAYLRIAPGRTPETVDAEGQAQCTLAVDAGGTVHVAYLSRSGLRYARRASGGWTASTVDAQAAPGIRRVDGPALALAPDGAPRIAYRRPSGGGVTGLAVALRDGQGWGVEATGIVGLVGPRSLSIDALGASRLATTDALGQSLTAWLRGGRGWVVEHSESPAPNAGDGPPIAIDAGGRARFAGWWRAAPTTEGAVALRWSESGTAGWRTETIATLPALGARVAIGQADATPRVAAIDAAGVVRVYARTGGVWAAETVAAQGGAAASLDFVVGPDGQLRVAFDRLAEGEVVLASRLP